MQIRGRRYDDGTSVSVTIDKGFVTNITPVSGEANDPWLVPGFVDLQVNGFGGQEFNDFELTTEKVIRVSQAMDADGVTSYLPTTTTHSFEMLSHAMKTLAAACEESTEVDRRVPGFHVEGPYISNKMDRAARIRWNIAGRRIGTSFKGFREAAGGRVRILTLSPEYDGAAKFIVKAVAAGVLIALGHTAANSDQIRAAVDAGATMSTHLGNGAHGQIRRHPNYIWDQLAEDRLVASLIVDGHHLPPAVVKSFVRGKTPQRCVLVSDLVGMAGMPPGQYTNTSIGNIEILEGGKIVVAGQQQYLAGAGLPITYGVANIMRFADCDLRMAIEMASVRPAELIGQTPAQLAVGSRADLVAFDLPEVGPVQVRQTINRGEVVFDAA